MQCPTKNDQYTKTNGCLKHKIFFLLVTQFLDGIFIHCHSHKAVCYSKASMKDYSSTLN